MKNIDKREFFPALQAGGAALLLMLTCTVTIAALAAWLLDYEFAPLLLSSAPGAVESVAFVAIISGLDVAFILKACWFPPRTVPATNGMKGELANLAPIPSDVIDWTSIERQYDEMVKHAAAMHSGIADAEAILRRFARSEIMHPTYKALAELGRAIKTIFLCCYLRMEAFRQEIHENLNVVENWNSATSFVFFGKGGEVATNRVENQEISVLGLHLL